MALHHTDPPNFPSREPRRAGRAATKSKPKAASETGTARVSVSSAAAPPPAGAVGAAGHSPQLDPYLARAIEAAIGSAAAWAAGDVAVAEAARRRRLTENARSLLRLLSGSEPLRAAPLDLGDLLMALLPTWNHSAPHHSFELALLGEIPSVVADAERVEQALDRLLVAAVGMTPDGGTVRVSVRPRGDAVVVSVRHYGLVPAWARAAELFDLGDPDGEAPLDERSALHATLDLALARAIVERHGGRAWTEHAGADQGRTGLALRTAWPLVPPVASLDASGGSAAKPESDAPQQTGPHTPLVARERAVVLVVEADGRMGRFLKANCEAQGLAALTAGDIAEAAHLVDLEAPDLVLLDGALAAPESFAPLRHLLADAQCPIVVLARHSDPLACAHALDLGASDWIARPFSAEELFARVRAVLRAQRSFAATTSEPTFTTGELTIDFAQRLVTVAGAAVALSKTEYKLLRTLAQHPGMVLAHDMLLERVWGPGYGDAVEFVWVYIRRLRRKIEPDPARPRYILTVPGVGYRLARD